MQIFIDVVPGDFKFAEWEEDGWKQFNRKVHELRVLGYRKMKSSYDWLNYYEYYKKKGSKKVVTVTMMLA